MRAPRSPRPMRPFKPFKPFKLTSSASTFAFTLAPESEDRESEGSSV